MLPLFPQYSASTTASAFDHIAHAIKLMRNIPQINMIHDYADHLHYVNAISNSIKNHWEHYGKPQHLLFSFHGIPKRYVDLGDIYPERCLLTTRLVVEKLQLTKQEWSLSFQSRLGRAPWLTPYTDNVLGSLPAAGITDLQVICPGFAVDCLETLEEISIRGKETFLHAGGVKFQYIPALNDSDAQVEALTQIVYSKE